MTKRAWVRGVEEERELSQKINALADKRYGQHDAATIKTLFLSYDTDGDALLTGAELREMLADADIGNFATRGFWVDGIFEKLDKSPTDGKLSWEEYLAAKSKTAPPTTPTTPGTPPPTPQQPTSLYCNWETNVCTSDPANASSNAGGVSLLAWGIPLGLSIGMVWLLARK